MTVFLFPGSFDPFTRGHQNIARRAAKICDKLYVAVMNNDSKTQAFTLEEREDMVKKSLADIPNIEVVTSSGLLVDLVKELQVTSVVRGIRTESDFHYEAEMALANRLLYPDYDVIFLPCREDLVLTSSSIVKEVGHYGGDLSKMVPSEIVDFVAETLKNRR